MKRHPLILICLVVAICFSGCKNEKDNAIKWEYKTVTWSQLYRPLMLGMEQNGEAKFFSDPEKSSWMIDMRNGLALMEKDEKENYFVKKLDELGNDGWELAATIGNERPTYIFKRIKK